MVNPRATVPTDDQLSKAATALKELAKKERPTPAAKIWQTLGGDIEAARKAGHSWDEIVAALATAGIKISAATLRGAAPGKVRKPRAKEVGNG